MFRKPFLILEFKGEVWAAMKIICVFCTALGVSFFFNSIESSYGKVDEINYESISILAPCLLSLTQKYFKSKRAMRGSLVIANLIPHPKSLLQRRMLRALNEDSDHAFGIMVKDAKLPHKNASRVTDKAQNYMLLMLDLSDLDLTLIQWKSLPTWNPLASTVIFFMDPLESIEEKDRLVEAVFVKLLKSGIINANAVFQMSNNPYKMEVETWFPYNKDGCAKEVKSIYKIDECIVTEIVGVDDGVVIREKEIIEHNENLFPKIPNTLHSCPLKVSTFIWEPFVVGDDEVKSGLEIQMLQTITQQMEMKLEFNILKDKVVSKKISDDNQTGIYADLIQKRSDALVGGLYENPISRKLVSSSIPYFQDDITWCVSKASLAPTWLNVFIIFNKWTWFGLVITLVVTSLFFYYFVRYEGNYRENYVWSLLITMSLATAQPANYWPDKSGIRMFLAGLFFFGIHISTAYHSFLINVLTNPRYNDQINTVIKAIEEGIVFNVDENTVEFFKKDDPVSKHLLLNHKICYDIDECFKQITTNRTKALAVSRAHALNNPFNFKENDEFYCFAVSDDVFIYSAVMMFQRFHHLLPIINEKIRAIAETGLLTKWQKDSARSKQNVLSDDDNSKGGHGSVQMKLRLEHVEGAFLVVLIGLSIAFVVFLLEFLMPWLIKKKQKKSHRILKTIESFLCHA